MKSPIACLRFLRPALAACAVSSLSSAGAQPLPAPPPQGDIVRIGPALTLVVPDPPSPQPKPSKPVPVAAAERLAMLLGRATGVAPGIVPAAQKPEEGAKIFVGFGPHLAGKVTPPAKPEGSKIQEIGGSVYLLGEIAPVGAVNNPSPLDRGVMHAVETFAEQVLGYRFLFSSVHQEEVKNHTFELGTVIPKLDQIEVPKGLRVEDAPVFTHRIMSSRPRSLIGLREGSAPGFYANHSYDMGWWGARFGKSAPDMFIPKTAKDGQEDDKAVEAMQSQPNLAWLDFTNPKVLEVRLQEIEKEVSGQRGSGFYCRPTRVTSSRKRRTPPHLPSNTTSAPAPCSIRTTTRRGNTLYVHLIKEPETSAVLLPPLTILPRRATLLNTGEAVGFDITDLPRLYKENPNRCLRLKPPIPESGTAGWVIQLDFDQLPATTAMKKHEQTR